MILLSVVLFDVKLREEFICEALIFWTLSLIREIFLLCEECLCLLINIFSIFFLISLVLALVLLLSTFFLSSSGTLSFDSSTLDWGVLFMSNSLELFFSDMLFVVFLLDFRNLCGNDTVSFAGQFFNLWHSSSSEVRILLVQMTFLFRFLLRNKSYFYRRDSDTMLFCFRTSTWSWLWTNSVPFISLRPFWQLKFLYYFEDLRRINKYLFFHLIMIK